MSNRPKGLILDFGGVLTTPLLPAVLAFERREGLPQGACLTALYKDDEGVRITSDLERGAVSQTEWNEFAGKMLGVSPENLMGRIFGDLRPEPLLIDAAAAARRAGIKVSILSNSVGLAPWDLYDGYELERLYDVVVISEHHLLRKPDPELFEITLKLMGLSADECVFVDDTVAYTEAAEKLGITGVHNQDPKETVAALSELFGVDLATA
ncbi:MULTISPECIES: HAD-IA family hydrolase [Streptomyces]|uniref:HAD-superfamily hydrolase subfamily IA, variant 3 n=1 Tax=Streptomyces venezuelae (strain ATCC 10712 / CBS 650.69 / DSM 40230 / JCM 4526 / NBRC 13096 / PD 04745) TaxID=953739 RepID=F2R9A8_STRVP|nr:HAD-IA family hydrolase [Streptomyces venezuelae]APE24499.1 haloacid dehalogenase [Streptomyces venezuelae]QES01860.1 HAD family hydrolase [Streptomyces venezuelae ATCC 10712]CCA58951.1 HAD-superfamily hydrolase subfamily IA, variant 3 [Streptomyces venezuelae ATCC 10712]